MLGILEREAQKDRHCRSASIILKRPERETSHHRSMLLKVDSPKNPEIFEIYIRTKKEPQNIHGNIVN